MPSLASLLVPCFLCASAFATAGLPGAYSPSPAPAEAAWLFAPAGSYRLEPFAPATASALHRASAAPAPALAPQPAQVIGDGLHSTRLTFKAGYYDSDEDSLDDGTLFALSWSRYVTSLLALELEAGYLDADGEHSGLDAELTAIPLMINARLNLPILLFEVYGGAGVGVVYYDAELRGPLGTATDDGFISAGNLFLGGSFNVLDTLAVGLEAKYWASETIDVIDASLQGYSLSLTLGLSW